MSAVLLKFNGHLYDVTRLIAQAQAGPFIRVKCAELAFVPTLMEADAAYRATLPKGVNDKSEPFVIFYKLNGEYYTLLGGEHAQALKVAGKVSAQGHLISTAALKKARLDQSGSEAALLERGAQRPFAALQSFSPSVAEEPVAISTPQEEVSRAPHGEVRGVKDSSVAAPTKPSYKRGPSLPPMQSHKPRVSVVERLYHEERVKRYPDASRPPTREQQIALQLDAISANGRNRSGDARADILPESTSGALRTRSPQYSRRSDT